jgi:hypothetical protein
VGSERQIRSADANSPEESSLYFNVSIPPKKSHTHKSQEVYVGGQTFPLTLVETLDEFLHRKRRSSKIFVRRIEMSSFVIFLPTLTQAGGSVKTVVPGMNTSFMDSQP